MVCYRAIPTILLCLLTVGHVHGQMEHGESLGGEEDEIETDRDSFTPTTRTVGEQRIVVESAYSYIENREVAGTHSLPELLIRFGWGEFCEFRIGTNYEIGGAGNPISANVPDDEFLEGEVEEESNIAYGLKLGLTRQRQGIPQSALLIQGQTPTAGESTDTHFVTTYVAGWTLPNAWVWDTALRFSTGSSEDDRFNVWAPSTVVKAPIGERWKGHLEYFAVCSDGRAHESVQQFISPGIHYLVSPDWEVGLRVGWGLNQQSPEFFSNVGIGLRF